MISALDSGSSGLGSSTGRDHSVVFLGKKDTVITCSAPFHPGEKWVPANCQGNLTKLLGVS